MCTLYRLQCCVSSVQSVTTIPIKDYTCYNYDNLVGSHVTTLGTHSCLLVQSPFTVFQLPFQFCLFTFQFPKQLPNISVLMIKQKLSVSHSIVHTALAYVKVLIRSITNFFTFHYYLTKRSYSDDEINCSQIFTQASSVFSIYHFA